jgi:hypothetical protein
MAGGSMDAQFTSPRPGLVLVNINPSSPVFDKVGVRFFVAVGQPTVQVFEKSGVFNKVFGYADRAIFERMH